MNIKIKLFICQGFNKITILIFLGELMAIASIQRFLLNFCLGVALTLTTSPVWAADKITFFDPPFGEFDVLVKDLEIFANEGKITPSFAYYANRVSPEELQKFRQVLKISLPFNEVNVYNFLNSYIGKEASDQLIKVINTPSEQSRSFLEGALIEAASQPQGLTILNVLQQYGGAGVPVTIPLNLTAVKNTINQVDELITATQRISNWFKQNHSSLTSAPTNSSLSVLAQAGSASWSKHSLPIARLNKPPILAVVYLPQNSQQPVPVVVIAPGLNSDTNSLAYVAEHLASHGFGVAALNFPDTEQQRVTQYLEGMLPNRPQANAWLEQPKDITLLLDTIAKKVQSDPAWQGKLDLNSVGVLGQSLGGYTALAIGGSQIDWNNLVQTCQTLKNPEQIFLDSALLWQCRGANSPPPESNLQDKRVKAVVAINPVSSPIFFGEKGLSQMKVPVMLFASSDDKFAPAIPQQLRPFTQLTQPEK
jgi:predicted dienelactone hydrolase